MRNGDYAILKSFAELERTPGPRPGPSRSGRRVDREGVRSDAARFTSLDALTRAAAGAWSKAVPTVLEVPIVPEVPPLA
jgi:benzoylformate decarboxylase